MSQDGFPPPTLIVTGKGKQRYKDPRWIALGEYVTLNVLLYVA